jgi:internalin A
MSAYRAGRRGFLYFRTLLLGAVLAFGPASAWAVTIPDPNLESALRVALNISFDELQQVDLASLTSFSASTQNIADLSGLEFCVNLTTLELDNNAIVDLTPLSGLTGLVNLYLNTNQIEDLSPLAGLTGLEQLTLDVNQISNLSPLAGMTSLTFLALSENRISDISALGAMTNLTSLDLQLNRVNDVSVLQGLTSLETLEAWGNMICDVSALVANAGLDSGDNVIVFENPLSTTACSVDLPALRSRNVNIDNDSACATGGLLACPFEINIPDPNLEEALRNQLSIPIGPLYNTDLAGVTQLVAATRTIADLTGLEHCTNLTSLNLFFNQVSDLTPLAGLTSLTELNLFFNQVSDVSPLAGLTNLVDLSVASNDIVDITPLAGLTNLTVLNLFDNQIVDIAALAGMIRLTELSLFGNQISDVSPLADKTDLLTLDLGANRIIDIGPLAGLISLTELDLFNNQISDIEPLSALSDLTVLGLDFNDIQDLSPLAGLGGLTELDLASNDISSVAPLSRVLNLVNLDLGNNAIRDLTPLDGMADLTLLNLDNNRVVNLAPLDQMDSMYNLSLNSNQIVDISPLAELDSLSVLSLINNQICDLSPLLASGGLGTEDLVDVRDNPLSFDTCDTVFSVLRDRSIVVEDGGYCIDNGLLQCPFTVLYVERGVEEGSGSSSFPFGAIQPALDLASSIVGDGGAVLVMVGPGIYQEVIAVPPGVRLVGSGQGITRILPNLDQLSGLDPVVITGAGGSSIESLTVELPDGAPPVTVIAIDDVDFKVLDVEIDGNQSPDSTGVRVIGANSSDSLVKDCVLHDLTKALEISRSAANFAFNKFDGITGPEAVRIGNVLGSVPELGDVLDLVNSGSNVFTNISGKFIQSNNPAETRAQANYWDNLPVESQIASQIGGAVDVSLPLFTLDTEKGGAPSATLFATVIDDGSNEPVSGVDVTLVASSGTLPMSSTAGLYVAAVLPLGRYTVRARKTGYEDQVELLDAGAGVNSVTLRLGGAPGGGEGEDGVPLIHAADTNANGKLDLSETLRVIQLYNAGVYSCNGTDPDGYQVGPTGGQGCQAHGADYKGGAADWRFNLSELLRVVQFFNTGGYYRCVGDSEDGYCAKDW